MSQLDVVYWFVLLSFILNMYIVFRITGFSKEEKYGLFDRGKALRIALDYVMEEADQTTVFEEVRCNRCANVPNQD